MFFPICLARCVRTFLGKKGKLTPAPNKITEGKPTPARGDRVFETRDANTSKKKEDEGKPTPAFNSSSVCHFSQTPYSVHRRLAHDHAVVFYSKTRSIGSYVHIPFHIDRKVTPKWDIKEEREEEAKNPGPPPTPAEKSDGAGCDQLPRGEEHSGTGATDKDEPRGSIGNDDGIEEELLILESINTSSAHANKQEILEGDAHIQFLQEACLTKTLLAAFDKDAKAKGKRITGGPLDPEHTEAAAGVAAVAVKGLIIYPITQPIDDYLDEEKRADARSSAST